MKAIVEGVELERLYRGAYRYRRLQPGQQLRVEAGEGMFDRIVDLNVLVWWGLGALEINGKVRSEVDRDVYTVRIMFLDVELSKKWNEYTPIKMQDSKTGEEFYVQFIGSDTEVAVLCTCMDFACRWAKVLKKEGGLIGRPRACPRKPGSKRKSQNVVGVLAVCKHLYAVLEWLSRKGLISDKLSAGVEIDLTDLRR